MPGWQLNGRTEARTSRPLAVKVIKDQEQGVLWMRALRMPMPANVAGAARRRQPSFDKGFGDGADLCRLDQQAIPGVVPANANRAVTADARAHATAGEGMSIRAGCSRWTMMPTGSSERGAPDVNSPPIAHEPGSPPRMKSASLFSGVPTSLGQAKASNYGSPLARNHKRQRSGSLPGHLPTTGIMPRIMGAT